MNDSFLTLLRRAFFAAAFVCAGLAVVERLLRLAHYTLLRGYTPESMMQLAAEALLFVIALELREITHLQKRG